jgi:hypothetical protein
MKVVYEYSHFGGSEVLTVRYPQHEQAIYEILTKVKAERIVKYQDDVSFQQLLYSPENMYAQFRHYFNAIGFEEIRDTYTISIPNHDHEIPGAYKQVDFVKDKVLVEVQFGKYAFMFYDMAKFQYFFNENKADVGIEIVPCHSLQKQMSSGVSYGEQLVYDIERLKRHFPAVPVKIMLIEVDE